MTSRPYEFILAAEIMATRVTSTWHSVVMPADITLQHKQANTCGALHPRKLRPILHKRQITVQYRHNYRHNTEN